MRELDVSTQATLEYLSSLGFRFIDVEAKIGGAQPDIVVYSDEKKQQPVIVAEIKRQLPSELELLHPAVQQAFRYSALVGNKAGLMLVSDGENHHWFRLKDDGASLDYAKAPKPLALPDSGGDDRVSANQILHSVLQRILISLKNAGIRVDLRSGRDILRIVVAQLVVPDNRKPNWAQPGDDARKVIDGILEQLFGGQSDTHGDWTLSEHVVRDAAYSLQRIPRDRLLRTTTARLFWTEIAPLLIDPDQAWCSPRPLANFLVAIIEPKAGERIIDPACGTAQFLVEAHIFRRREEGPKFVGELEDSSVSPDMIGYERDPVVAEVARLNIVLAGLGGGIIKDADSLQSPAIGRNTGQFDLVISDPPVGRFDQSRANIPLERVRSLSGKIETAFVEQAVHLLRPGGRAALLLPEGLFFSQNRRPFREWLLSAVKIDAIVSLPSGAWTTAKSHTQASVLVFTKQEQQADRSDYPIFVADLRSPDDLESKSNATLQSRLDQTRDAFLKFSDERVHGLRAAIKSSGGSIISSHFLTAERFDVAGIMLEAWRRSPLAIPGKYSVAKLSEIADIILGRHVKKVSERTPALSSANYIQAGNVRRFEIDLNEVPRLTADEVSATAAARVTPGDVLITSTGQYLGRAALVTKAHIPAVASNAVTILRIRNSGKIDPRYLVAFLNSPAGVDQFEQRRIKGVAQPYLRRRDVEEIAIPLPPLEVQESAANEIWDLLARADGMAADAERMRMRAHTLLVDVLSERPIQ